MLLVMLRYLISTPGNKHSPKIKNPNSQTLKNKKKQTCASKNNEHTNKQIHIHKENELNCSYPNYEFLIYMLTLEQDCCVVEVECHLVGKFIIKKSKAPGNILGGNQKQHIQKNVISCLSHTSVMCFCIHILGFQNCEHLILGKH